jgi:uncharacterized RDD family membrane protein YckC
MAAAIDLGVLTAAFALSFDVRASLVAAILRRPLSLAAVIIVGAVLVLVGGGIVLAFWALVGHTPGIRFLAIRLSRADGSREVSFGCAVRRVLAVIVSLLPLGLGYFSSSATRTGGRGVGGSLYRDRCDL